MSANGDQLLDAVSNDDYLVVNECGVRIPNSVQVGGGGVSHFPFFLILCSLFFLFFFFFFFSLYLYFLSLSLCFTSLFLSFSLFFSFSFFFSGKSYSVTRHHPISSPPPFTTSTRLGFCYQPSCDQPTELIWAFLFQKFSDFTPPPIHILTRRSQSGRSALENSSACVNQVCYNVL